MGSSFATKIKVGVTSILAVVIFFGGILWVKQYNPMVGRTTLHVAFDDARGIYAGDPVTISGIKVGEIEDVSLGEHNEAHVSFSVPTTIRIPADTKFMIEDVGMMGDKMLVIEPGESSGTIDPSLVHRGSGGSGLGDLLTAAGEVLFNLRAITKKLDNDLDLAGLTGSFEETLDKMREAVDVYQAIAQENREPLKSSIGSLESSAQELEQFIATNDDRFAEALASFRRTSDRITVALDEFENLSTVVDTLSRYMESGEGTLGKLVKSDDLYDELRRTNAHIDSFVTDFKRNPGKYTKDMQFKIRLF